MHDYGARQAETLLCTFIFNRVHVFAKVNCTIEVRQRLNNIESESLFEIHTKATTTTLLLATLRS